MEKVEVNDEAYVKRTPTSRTMFERARKVEPAGVSYKIRFFEPYPFFVRESEGARITDLDGNVFTDYWSTHFAMILGHRHPIVLEAIKNQAENGWHHGLSHELEITHAEAITKHTPSAEMVRYASSGSEAMLFATRLARTFTKRPKVAKFEGAWHGAYDPFHMALKPPFDTPATGGLTMGSQQDTIALPYNDMNGFLDNAKHESLACVILEPVLGASGMIPAEREFLKGLRNFCDETGALLIFDEVVTGFRLGLGGAQSYFGVKPDLTVLGKIIGGGLPIGAICGREDVMSHFDHTKYSGLDYAHHGGTFSGNALTLAAGLATIDVLEHSPVYEHIDRLGAHTRERLNSIFEAAEFPAQTIGLGSLFGIHTSLKKPLKDAKSYALCDHNQSKNMFRFLLDNDIFMLTPEMLHGCISYAHTESDIAHLASTVQGYVNRTKETSSSR